MAVWVYKDGEGSLINPLRLQAHLDAGYSLDKESKAKVEAVVIAESGDLSNTEIRAAAKKAGIDNYKTGRIAKLKELLGYE